jgi:hypothetical protein
VAEQLGGEPYGSVTSPTGTYVVPDADRETVLAAVRDGAVVLEFPVEVEVRIVPACDPDRQLYDILERFALAVRGLA